MYDNYLKMMMGGLTRTKLALGTGDQVQDSGIKSLEKKMASQPDIGATRNDAAMNLFGKPLIELTPQELDQLDEFLEETASKRKAPSIKMASGSSDLDDMYKQYVFEMEEMGLQPMSFRQFLEQAIAESKL